MTEENQGVEGWFPENRAVPDVRARLAGYKHARIPYVVLQPHTPVVFPEALRDVAQAQIGMRYPWWQVVWYALTGWFVQTSTPNAICSRLVPLALSTGGVSPWRAEVLDALFRLNRRKYDWLMNHWATPHDLYTYGAFRAVYVYDPAGSTGALERVLREAGAAGRDPEYLERVHAG